MPVKFQTMKVEMAGMDMHRIGGGNRPHSVLCPFDWHSNNGKFAKTVTGHTYAMVQRGYQMGFVPHVTIAKPSELPELGATIVSSSSKSALGVATVSAEGTPLACSVSENGMGVNLNCQSVSGNSVKAPTGFTEAEFPILTRYQWSDLYDALLTTLWDTAFGWGSGQTVDRLGKGKSPQQRSIIKKFISEKVKPIIEKGIKRLGHATDRGPTSSDFFDTVLD
ncbi:MAG: hypothetical protein HOW73_12500 [Polyangiaceae bacterium]|nr:hypothetical protein [Polyangiaceae bacterium]